MIGMPFCFNTLWVNGPPFEFSAPHSLPGNDGFGIVMKPIRFHSRIDFPAGSKSPTRQSQRYGDGA
jgi:hypothetical protein